VVNGTDWAGLSGNTVVALANTNRNGTDFNSAGTTELVNLTTSASLSAIRTIGALKLSPSASGQSLDLATFNLNTNGVLLSGSTDFAITAPSVSATAALFGTSSGTKYLFVNNPATTLSISTSMAGAANPVTKGGDGIVALTGGANQLAFSSNQNVNLTAGTFRVTSASIGGFAANNSPNATFRLRGGILDLDGGGTFTRFLGAGAAGGGGVRWNLDTDDAGSGGFSAINGDTSVTLVDAVGGSSPISLTWDLTTDFIQSGYALMFGSSTATNKLTFTNNIALDNGLGNYNARQIHVFDNTSSSGDVASLSGTITGTVQSDLLKTGGGVLELTGNNNFAGNTLVSAGTLLVNNTAGNGTGTGTVVVFSGATLGGGGSVGGNLLVQSGGTLAPGNSPGRLTVAGETVFNSGSIFSIELNGTTAGTEYDQLKINSGGSVNLGNATLSATTNGFAFTPSDRLAIIWNDNSSTLSTTFNGLVDNATLTIGGYFAQITYQGNYNGTTVTSLTGGNDVVLYNFQPVPETEHVLLLCAGAVGVAFLVRRRYLAAV
jgi:autotransporter-associated beta strand protein